MEKGAAGREVLMMRSSEQTHDWFYSVESKTGIIVCIDRQWSWGQDSLVDGGLTLYGGYPLHYGETWIALDEEIRPEHMYS
jgi:hypothetical protein